MDFLGWVSVVKGLAEVLVAIAALFATFRWLPVIFDGLRLMRERDEARGEATHFKDLTNAMGGGAAGLSVLIQELRLEISSMRDEIDEMRKVQIVSARYTAALIGHISDGGLSGSMPAIPDELRDDVLEEIRKNHGARPVVA